MCVFTTVCVHLDGLNAVWVTWPHVTSKKKKKSNSLNTMCVALNKRIYQINNVNVNATTVLLHDTCMQMEYLA